MQDYKSILESGNYYHIYNRANGNEKLFLNDDNYNYFLEKYNYYILPIADTFAYCLMPNHFHFLVRIKAITNLQGIQTLERLQKSKYISQQFSNFFNAYTQAFNKQNNRKGSLFIPRFNRKKITSQEYLINTVNYIHQNPITHGYVKELNEWSYSSFKIFLSNKKTNICRNEVLDWFNDKENFIAYHNIKKAEKFGLMTNLIY